MSLTHRIARWIAAGALGLSLLPIGAAHASGYDIAARFSNFYNTHQGIRVLGNAVSNEINVGGYPAQFFEKARIEDHSRETSNPAWKIQFGLLTREMMVKYPTATVNNTSVTYGELERLAANLHAAPAFKDGVQPQADGSVFVPWDAQLKAAPGFYAPAMFWKYINRKDLFPGGWQHDIGIPMGDVLTVETIKNGEKRTIQMQAYERTVLTYDPKNPADWQIERGNIGADMIALPAQ
jgi:hypothetical protein